MREAASAFAREHGLRCDAFGDQRDDDGRKPVGQELAGLLARSHPGDPAWWCEIGRAFQTCGCPLLTRACAERGRRLAEDGAETSWAVLQDLAALLAEPVPGKPESAEADVVPSRLALETSAAKRARVGVLFGLGGRAAVKQRVEALTEAENAEALIVSKPPRGIPGLATPARLWHRSGYYRLVIERLFAEIADKPLSGWLPAASEALAWCGWSFHRIGDRPTACACFRLSVALEDPKDKDSKPAKEEREQLDEERPPGPSLDASEYLDRFGGDADEAGPGGDLPLFVQFARLASWLEERGLQGYLERLAAPRDQMRSAALALTMQDVGRRSGWFLPPRLAPISAQPPVVGHVPGLPPLPLADDERKGAAACWTPPARLAASPARSAPAARIPIGVAEAGGVAELEIRPGEPALLIGVPAAEYVLERAAIQLAAEGWAVLWMSQGRHEAAIPAAGWHRLEASRKNEQGEFWLTEMTGFQPLRRAVTDCLLTRFATHRDLDSVACVEDAVASLGPGSDAQQILLSGTEQRLRKHAVEVVDSAVRLRFHGPRDLRRAARLVELVKDAMLALRNLAWTRWVSADAGPAEGAGVYVRLAADGFDAALLAAMAAGSMLHTANLDNLDSRLTLVLRERPSMSDEELAELKAMTPDPAPPPSNRSESRAVIPPDLLLPGNPWVEKGLITPGSARPLCVLSSGAFGPAAAAVTAVLKPAWGARDVSLVTAITNPTGAETPAVRDYATIVLGQLPPDLLLPFGIAAGIRLSPGLTDGLGQHGAVRVQTGAGQRPQRLVVWPAADGRR